MNTSEDFSVLACLAPGERAFAEGEGSPDEQWLLREARLGPLVSDLEERAALRGWSRPFLSSLVSTLAARGWVSLSPGSPTGLPQSSPSVATIGRGAQDGARSLEALLSRHHQSLPSSPAPSARAEDFASPLPTPASREAPPALAPLAPASLGADAVRETEADLPASRAPLDDVLVGVSSWSPEPEAQDGDSPEVSRVFDESAVAVPEEGGDDLLRAMGITGEKPAPAPPPPPPAWDGSSGIDALMDLLSADPAPPSGVPAYGYGGQGSAPVAQEPHDFPRLRDAPGSPAAVGGGSLPGDDVPIRGTSQGERHSGLIPHSELARQRTRLQSQEDARAAARRKLHEFRHRNEQAKAEHDHVVNRQKQIEEHTQAVRTARGLGNRLAQLREQQEATRRGKT